MRGGSKDGPGAAAPPASPGRAGPASRRGRGAGARPERGSVTVLAAAVLVLCGVLALASADVMRALEARARAQAAADAAALAAAQELAVPSGRSPAEAAWEYAVRNGATLRSCRCQPGTSEARVEVAVSVPLVFLGPAREVVGRARAVVASEEGPTGGG